MKSLGIEITIFLHQFAIHLASLITHNMNQRLWAAMNQCVHLNASAPDYGFIIVEVL
jgi:hypothetical protein